MDQDALARSMTEAARAVEAELDRLLPDPDGPEAPLIQAMRYATLGGGKRLRAFLVLAGAGMFDADPAGARRTAAAIECLHAYSLVHDDLPAMDDATTRRGRPACHRAFDEATAILAGDALQALAFEILADPLTHTDPAARADLVLGLACAGGAAGMCGGQMIDLVGERRPLEPQQALRMERLKTGAVMVFAAEAGAVLGGAGAEARARLRAFGDALGLAFQLRDDEIDRTGDAAAAGKDLRRDAEAGKATPHSRLGEDGVGAALGRLGREAEASLAPFGGRAAPLRAAFAFAITRNV